MKLLELLFGKQKDAILDVSEASSSDTVHKEKNRRTVIFGEMQKNAKEMERLASINKNSIDAAYKIYMATGGVRRTK